MKTEKTVIQWLKDASLVLFKKTESPLSDARVLLSRHLQVNTAWLAAHPDEILGLECLAELDQQLSQLASGVPLPYVINHWEFFGLDFYVTPAVLIPRPETEILVEVALAWLDEHPQVSKAYDVGTGSGCIAVALAHQKPRLQVVAIDKSESALDVAKENVKRHNLTKQIDLRQNDLLAGLPIEDIHLMCANLPYIPSGDLLVLDVARHEPIQALDGGVDGLDLSHALLKQASPRLNPPFCILLEMEYRQAEAMVSFTEKLLPEASVNVIRDISGLSRVICIEGE
jgi:release factor glutamine methyltransferase